jgi:hypothetical protein
MKISEIHKSTFVRSTLNGAGLTNYFLHDPFLDPVPTTQNITPLNISIRNTSATTPIVPITQVKAAITTTQVTIAQLRATIAQCDSNSGLCPKGE